MGLLRFLLSASVILAHSASFFGFSGMGSSAVPAFFIVSGFYMSLILSTKYLGPNRIWLFYSNRALRLYPVYFAVLAVFVALSQLGVGAWPMSQISTAAANPLRLAVDGTPPSLWAAIPNLTFVGADVIRVFVVDLETMHLQPWLTGIVEGPNYRGSYQYLVMPPIWSLGVEIVFYAMAPLLASLSNRQLFVLSLIALVVNLVMYYTLRGFLAWFHLLAPLNIIYFIIGMLVHRSGSNLRSSNASKRGLLISIPFILWACWQLLPSSPLLTWAAWFCFAAALPSLFQATKNSRVDAALGAYSYPMYLCHTLFTWPMLSLGPWAGVAAIGLSAALSWLLISLIDRPIEAWRQRRVKRLVPV